MMESAQPCLTGMGFWNRAVISVYIPTRYREPWLSWLVLTSGSIKDSRFSHCFQDQWFQHCMTWNSFLLKSFFLFQKILFLHPYHMTAFPPFTRSCTPFWSRVGCHKSPPQSPPVPVVAWWILMGHIFLLVIYKSSSNKWIFLPLLLSKL